MKMLKMSVWQRMRIRFITAGRVMLFAALCALLIGALSGAISYLIGNHGDIRRESFSLPKFDSRSSVKQERLVKSLQSGRIRRGRALRLGFSFKVYQVRQFDNLFQTDPVNLGVRMEMSVPSALALIIAGEGGPKGIYITRDLKLNKIYRIELNLDKSDNVRVFLNGRLVIDECVLGAQYGLSDVSIGAGFGKTRGFDGEIADFFLESEFSPDEESAEKLRRVCFKAAFLFLTVAAILFFVSSARRATAAAITLAADAWNFLLDSVARSILLLHFFVFSLGMFQLFCSAARAVSFLTASDEVAFNEWVIPLVARGKNGDLVLYGVIVFLLAVYYSIYVMFRYSDGGEPEKAFRALFFGRRIRSFIYLCLMAALNLSVFQRDKGASLFYSGVFQPSLWFILFFAPLGTALFRTGCKRRLR